MTPKTFYNADFVYDNYTNINIGVVFIINFLNTWKYSFFSEQTKSITYVNVCIIYETADLYINVSMKCNLSLEKV